MPEHEYWLNFELGTARGIGRADLLGRAARASALHPGAFLSLHHDSVQRRYIEPWTAQDGTQRMHSETASHCSYRGETASQRESLAFASLLGSALLARGLHASPHHAEAVHGEGRPWADKEKGVYASDDLVVPKHTAAPAALLENNKDEEAILALSERRDRVAAAISEALVCFCDARLASALKARKRFGDVNVFVMDELILLEVGHRLFPPPELLLGQTTLLVSFDDVGIDGESTGEVLDRLPRSAQRRIYRW